MVKQNVEIIGNLGTLESQKTHLRFRMRRKNE